MRYPFLGLPDDAPTTRAVLPILIEGVERTTFPCLVDTGTLRNRFDASLAAVAGIRLDDAPEERFAIGGIVSSGWAVHVALQLGDNRFEAPVSFCDPWPFRFQVLGQEGFLRYFRVTICAAEEWLECVPELVES